MCADLSGLDLSGDCSIACWFDTGSCMQKIFFPIWTVQNNNIVED